MIITSLLDTDLYKFTMMQVILHRFPEFTVEYAFKCRNKNINLAPYVQEINDEIDNLCAVTFLEEELRYLQGLRYIKHDFIDFLRIFRLNRNYITVAAVNNDLDIRIRGPWLHTILFEVPVLAIVNEVYFRNSDPEPDYKLGRKLLAEKIDLIKETPGMIIFSDFGTRRRRSKKWQEEIVRTLQQEVNRDFIGTSNVYFAMKYNLTPVGTMAHEFLQACQAANVRLVDSQKFALESWVQEYRGDLGIALSDVVGMEAFLHDFDLYFAKLFDGARHDSGDPYVWCDELIRHYAKMKIDPKTKTAVFSDGLNFHKAKELAMRYKNRINIVFGIGTNLTNDFGDEALQIVIKMTRCNNQPVAKVSDSPGKSMCEDESFVRYLKTVFKIK